FFLFINYFDAHEPYDPPEPYRKMFGAPADARGNIRSFPLDKKTGIPHHPDGSPMTDTDFDSLRALYDGELRYLDDQLAHLWGHLAERHLLDNTLVMITADHGETIGEHRFLDHGHNLYQEQVHIPMIVSGIPSSAGKTVESLVEITDIFPTILQY